eukprot:g32045.t1
MQPSLEKSVLVLNFRDTLPVTADNIRVWTQKDPVLAKMKQLVVMGESEGASQPGLKPFWTRLNLVFPDLGGGNSSRNANAGYMPLLSEGDNLIQGVKFGAGTMEMILYGYEARLMR